MFKEFNYTCQTSTTGLPFFINKLKKDDLLGLELGVQAAFCSCIILQSCPTIKYLDLVDSYVPYYDFIGHEHLKFERRKYRKYGSGYVYEEDIRHLFADLTNEEIHEIFMESERLETPECFFDEDRSENYLNTAKNNLYRSGFVEKTKLHIMSTDEYLKQVPDEYYDFIFLDAHCSYKQMYEDLEKWLPKVKSGGVFSGHDYSEPPTWWAVENFRKFNNIEDKMYKCHNDAFVWYKDVKNGIMGLDK
jgi:hypothetical protein